MYPQQQWSTSQFLLQWCYLTFKGPLVPRVTTPHELRERSHGVAGEVQRGRHTWLARHRRRFWVVARARKRVVGVGPPRLSLATCLYLRASVLTRAPEETISSGAPSRAREPHLNTQASSGFSADMRSAPTATLAVPTLFAIIRARGWPPRACWRGLWPCVSARRTRCALPASGRSACMHRAPPLLRSPVARRDGAPPTTRRARLRWWLPRACAPRAVRVTCSRDGCRTRSALCMRLRRHRRALLTLLWTVWREVRATGQTGCGGRPASANL